MDEEDQQKDEAADKDLEFIALSDRIAVLSPIECTNHIGGNFFYKGRRVIDGGSRLSNHTLCYIAQEKQIIVSSQLGEVADFILGKREEEDKERMELIGRIFQAREGYNHYQIGSEGIKEI